MRGVALVAVVALAGCGRIGFDSGGGGGAIGDGPAAGDDAGATMVPSEIQSVSFAGDQGNNLTATFFAGVTQGDLVVVAFAFAPEVAVTEVEDTVGSRFTVLPAVDGSAGTRLDVAYAIAAASGHDEVTVLIADATTEFAMTIVEYTGTAATAPLQAMGTAQASDGTATVELATTARNEVVVAYAVTPDGNATPGSGMNELGVADGDLIEDAVAASPGAFAAAAATTGTMTLYAVAFRAAAL